MDSLCTHCVIFPHQKTQSNYYVWCFFFGGRGCFLSKVVSVTFFFWHKFVSPMIMCALHMCTIYICMQLAVPPNTCYWFLWHCNKLHTAIDMPTLCNSDGNNLLTNFAPRKMSKYHFSSGSPETHICRRNRHSSRYHILVVRPSVCG